MACAKLASGATVRHLSIATNSPGGMLQEGVDLKLKLL